jgi:hypothetical protein
VSTERGRVGGVIESDTVAAVRRGELERTMGPVLVVMLGVDAEDSFEVSASDDEDAIEAVAADGAHPALGEGVRVRRSHRSADHLDPVGCTYSIFLQIDRIW